MTYATSRHQVWLFALLVLFNASCLAAGPSFERIMILVLENTDYEEAARQPFLSQLAAEGALLTNYHAIGHPSQVNYIALVAGSRLGVSNNRNVDLSQRHLGDLLDEAGRSWRLYAEGYPGNCYLKRRQGKYVRKHVPFLSFSNVSGQPQRCRRRVVPAEQLEQDLRQGDLPELIFYVPDQLNNGHDTDITHADTWLRKTLGPWLANPDFTDGLLLVITFDESGHDDNSNRIFTLFYGSGVAAGGRSAERYDHYSLLRTLEDAWQLGSLNREDASAKPISGIWEE